MKRPLIIAVTIFSFGLGYVAGVASTPDGIAVGSEAVASAPKVQVTATGRRCHVNSESYAKLRMGMSLKQVEGIINCPGEAVSSNRIGRVTTEAYIWRAGYGAGIEAVFQRQTMSGSSRLMSLAQHGL